MSSPEGNVVRGDRRAWARRGSCSRWRAGTLSWLVALDKGPWPSSCRRTPRGCEICMSVNTRRSPLPRIQSGYALMANPSNQTDDRPASAPGRSVVREIADRSRLARWNGAVVGGLLLRSGHAWRLVGLPNVSRTPGRYAMGVAAVEEIRYAMRVRGGGWRVAAVWHNERAGLRSKSARWALVAPVEVQYLPGGDERVYRSRGRRYRGYTAAQVVGRITAVGRRRREAWRVRVEM